MVPNHLRIVMVTTSFPLTPASVSGIFLRRLLDHLPGAVTVTVITPCATHPPDPGNLPDHLRVRCCRYAPWSWQLLAHAPGGLPVAFRGRPWRLPLLLPFLLSLFWSVLRAARQADLIHANWSIIGVLAGLAGWIVNKPVVTTLRGSDLHRARDSRHHRRLLGWCLRLNRALVTVSAEFHALVTGWYPDQAHRITMIPNGIDCLPFAPRADPPPDQEPIPHLITIGNLIPHKGTHRLLTALATLRTRHPFRLTVIGDGPERANLETQTRQLDLTEQVHFTGQLPPEEIPARLARATLYVTASAGEGRSNALLEAMAAGLPVIAGQVPGMRELIDHEDNGLLFDPATPGTLATALERLITDPAAGRRMGLRGRKRLREAGLDWRTTAERYQQLWRRILCAD